MIQMEEREMRSKTASLRGRTGRLLRRLRRELSRGAWSIRFKLRNQSALPRGGVQECDGTHLIKHPDTSHHLDLRSTRLPINRLQLRRNETNRGLEINIFLFTETLETITGEGSGRAGLTIMRRTSTSNNCSCSMGTPMTSPSSSSSSTAGRVTRESEYPRRARINQQRARRTERSAL